MSNPNLPLGIALVCGAAACAITCAVTDLGAGVGVSLGAVVAGATLIFQGQQQKPAEQREEKESKKESKKSKGKKPEKKKQANTPSPRAPTTPEPAEKKKSEKPKKESAPKSPPQKSPAPKSPPQQAQQKAKSPQKTPSVESEQKEPTKTQLQKAKKKQKKEAEEKAKAEEKALEAKREQAQAKKAAKAAQKKKEKEIVSPQVQAQASEDDEDVKEEEVLEDGWEKPKPRNTVRIRSPKDIKKAKDAAVARSKGPSSEESKVVVEVRVPKNKHGSIIGQKGAFLQLIQDKTGATVTMPKREGGGLGVVISGSASQVKEAEQVVRDIANKGYSSLTHPGLESNELLLKDDKQVGRIAGKGGVYLKAIQEKSGASLQLPDRKSAQPSNKIIILGKPSEITNAKLALMDLLRQGYCEYTHPGWITEEFDFNSDYLGRLIGPKGAKIAELSHDFDVKIDTPKPDDPNNSKQDIISIKGTQSNIDRAKEAIQELLSQTEVTEEIPAPDPNDPWQQDPVEPEW